LYESLKVKIFLVKLGLNRAILVKFIMLRSNVESLSRDTQFA